MHAAAVAKRVRRECLGKVCPSGGRKRASGGAGGENTGWRCGEPSPAAGGAARGGKCLASAPSGRTSPACPPEAALCLGGAPPHGVGGAAHSGRAAAAASSACWRTRGAPPLPTRPARAPSCGGGGGSQGKGPRISPAQRRLRARQKRREKEGTVEDTLAEGGDGRPGEPSNPGRHHGADGGRPVTAPTAGTPTNRACAMMSANSARAMTTVDRARASGRQRPRRRRRRRRRPRGAVVGRTWPRPLRDGATPAWEPRAHSCRYHLSAVCRMARPGSRSVEGA